MPNRKLDAEDVISIREYHDQGIPVPVLMEWFEISRRTVYDIITRVTWKHI